MSSENVKQVIPFPFESLPQLDGSLRAEWQTLEEYYGRVKRSALLGRVAQILAEVLGSPCEVNLSGVEMLTGAQIPTHLPADFLGLLVKIEPQAKNALVFFELPLAHVLADAALGARGSESLPGVSQIKPVTPLSEAVLSYVLAAFLENLAEDLPDRQVDFRLDHFIRDAERVKNSLSARDKFIFFAVTVSLSSRRFYIKLALPLSLAESFYTPVDEGGGFAERFQSFGDFRIPYVVELGGLDLLASQLQNLEVGDVVLLHDVNAAKKSGKWQGEALLKPAGGEENPSWPVHFVLDSDVVKIQMD